MPSKLCEIIYLCVFSLLKMICMAAALFQGFQSLEKFRVGAPSTVHSERTLGYMDWAILIIIFHLCNLFEKVDHGHFWDHSFFLWDLLGAYKQSVKQCKASDFPVRKMPGGIFDTVHTKLHHRNWRPYSAQRNN